MPGVATGDATGEAAGDADGDASGMPSWSAPAPITDSAAINAAIRTRSGLYDTLLMAWVPSDRIEIIQPRGLRVTFGGDL